MSMTALQPNGLHPVELRLEPCPRGDQEGRPTHGLVVLARVH
jgi:hypothetical protein